MIAPGTPCFLVRLVEHPFSGRVVEVTGPPMTDPDDFIVRQRVDAQWLRDLYGDREVSAPPENLRPIAGPGLLTEREPVEIGVDGYPVRR